MNAPEMPQTDPNIARIVRADVNPGERYQRGNALISLTNCTAESAGLPAAGLKISLAFKGTILTQPLLPGDPWQPALRAGPTRCPS
jgi:hypothetical protein